MRKLKVQDAESVLCGLRETFRAEADARYFHRLHGVLLVACGLSCYQVAKWFGEDARTIERWVHVFEEAGVSGLRDHPRPGRPAKLSSAQLERLKRELRIAPSDGGDPAGRWDDRALAAHLLSAYVVAVSRRQCQRLLQALRSAEFS